MKFCRILIKSKKYVALCTLFILPGLFKQNIGDKIRPSLVAKE